MQNLAITEQMPHAIGIKLSRALIEPFIVLSI